MIIGDVVASKHEPTGLKREEFVASAEDDSGIWVGIVALLDPTWRRKITENKPFLLQLVATSEYHVDE